MIVLFLIAFLFAVTLYWYKLYNYYEEHLKEFPGPKPLPLIGNTHQFGTTADPLQAIIKFAKQYGKNFKLYVAFLPPSLVISDLEMVEYILSSNTILDKSVSYEYLKKWLGTRLLTSTGQKWRKHRKLLTPAFHFKILEQFTNVFNLFGNKLILKLEEDVDKGSVDVFVPVSLYTLDVICASSMGTNVDAQKTISAYVEAVKCISEIVISRSGSFFKSIEILYAFTYDRIKENRLLRLLHNFTESVIAKRRQELINKVDTDTSSDDLGIQKRLTFLDLMLQHQLKSNLISDTDIREEVDTFMFEGHDTTASIISFILYCLAENQKVQVFYF